MSPTSSWTGRKPHRHAGAAAAARQAPRPRGSLISSASALATLAMVPMLALAGLAVDSARALLVESRLNAALSSVTAGAGGDPDTLRRAVDAAFPDRYLDARVVAVQVRTDGAGIEARAHLPTTFLHILGRERVAVTARRPVSPGATQLAGAKR